MNRPEPIPEDIRRFVLTSIPSVPYLEALLLFHEAPTRPRDAAEVARLLYSSERATAPLLEALHEGGLLRREAGTSYVYAPRDDVLRDTVDRLARVYVRDLVGITTLIHDATQKNAQRFADAFKLRKDT